MKKIKEETPWIRAIDLLHDRMIAEHNDNDLAVEAGGEAWQITSYKYSSTRHRLTVEFDGGEFYLVFEYLERYERLCVEAWQDRRMISYDTEPSSDDEGRDEDSVMVLKLTYLPKVKGRSRSEKSLMMRDEESYFLFARKGEVAFFAFLLGKLEEYAGISPETLFDFRSALEYARKKETLWDAFQLMKRGMSDSWSQTAKDWDTLSDC